MAKEDEKKQPKTKQAKIEMKTASNSIQDSMTNVDVSCVPVFLMFPSQFWLIWS